MDKETEDQLDGTEETLDQDQLMVMIELQLSELDMLQSMFPDPKELALDDPLMVSDLKQFAEGRTKVLPPRLDYVVNLDVEKGQLNLSVNLPHEYPSSQPDVFVRSQRLNRDSQYKLNQELLRFLKSLDPGDLCIGPAVTWLQENGASFFTDDASAECSGVEQKPPAIKDTKFARLWIYSHHIYSKVKRKDILEMSGEFDLTGFCLPGKPGIICVEGLAHNTEDWWHQVRSWNWQKILIKKREAEDIGPEQDLSEFRRFSSFEELGSDNNIRVKGGGYHVDMGDVFRYLENHNSGYVFKEYFGVSGKPS